jgi:hypothetical protein
MVEPFDWGAFQARVKLVVSAVMHRKPETVAGEEARVVNDTTGE